MSDMNLLVPILMPYSKLTLMTSGHSRIGVLRVVEQGISREQSRILVKHWNYSLTTTGPGADGRKL